MTYVLVICAAISWGGCGFMSISPFPDEPACSRALKDMRVDDPIVGQADKRRSMLAYCRPAARGEAP